MPDPREGESRSDFVSRCIPIVLEDGTAEDHEQAVAVCNSMWESKKMTDSRLNTKDLIVFDGGEMKALGDGKVGGHLVMYGDPDTLDLEDDFFTAETDFGPHEISMVYYAHGLDGSFQKRNLGIGTLKQDDIGVWIESQLELRDKYEEAVYHLVDAGKLGWSSGTASHLVEREEAEKGHWIKKWPLGIDASLTPIPAEPRTKAIPLKSYHLGVEFKALLSNAETLRKSAEPPAMTEEEQREAAAFIGKAVARTIARARGVQHGIE